MSRIFLELLNISITAGWLILAVIVFRIVLRGSPKWIRCLLWGIVALRLLIPFNVESTLSLIPNARPVPVRIEQVVPPVVNNETVPGDNIINSPLARQFTPKVVEDIVNPLQVAASIASIIWLLGVLLMLLYAVFSFLRLRRRVSAAVPMKNKINLCDEIDSPFILGIFRPQIFLPSGMEPLAYEHIMLHEQAHLQRRDHIWKPLGFALLSVYWFNPLSWAAYIMFCKDIELASDEKATREMDKYSRADYCQALLTCSVNRRGITACPIAFGEVGVKDRVKNVLNYKKPAFWMVIAAILACVVAAVCFLTNPRTKAAEKKEIETVDTVALANTRESYKTGIEDEVYRKLIKEMLDTGVYPDGVQYDGQPYNNYYSVMDIDEDGQDELLINFSNGNTVAGMVYYIYDYNRTTGEVYMEHYGYPSMTIYDNGYIKDDASHNHGRSNLEDFWPYQLFRYNPDKDIYEEVAFIDAWQATFYGEGEADPDFPKDKDLDGDGIVYYDMSKDYYKPEMIMDNAEYEKWREVFQKGKEKSIHWSPIISEEEYYEDYPIADVPG